MAATKTVTKTVTRTATSATASKPAPRKATKAQKPSAFQALLAQPTQAAALAPLRAQGIAIGVVSVADGVVRVSIPGLALQDICAASMVPLGPQHTGQSVALGFEGEDAYKPIVLGLMMAQASPAQTVPVQPTPAIQDPEGTALKISDDGQRVCIEAGRELELKCGEAVILLTADGTVQLRGKYVTTDASANIRLRGGSVQLN